ncbi:MAG: isoleucine--tRNA ligase [Eubacteriales bacterium]
MAKDYTQSLNLPQTEFPMRANLPAREPEMLKRWQKIDLYNLALKKSQGRPTFEIHDGPPFSNGNIHMGTAMNKILKDFINRSKIMSGYQVPYTPGWDNHGMPIESAIIKQNKLDRKKMSIPEFRRACEEFAKKYVNLQMDSFKRLGVLGDWEHPYTTMAPSFEAREIKVFAEMFRKGYIYKGMKPVYWCPTDETALAEAEIEYQEDKCTSIYVKFAVADDKGILSEICDLSRTYFVIWTTTAWTLPGNQAIALHPDESYAVVSANGEYYIMAEALTESALNAAGIHEYTILKTFPGKTFEYMTAQHPFLDRTSLVVNADYVTMDSGTGCVHTAGGFGADDYVTSRRYNIDVIVPVDDRGYQTADAGKFAGMRYDQSGEAILADMKETGALFASEEIVHQYPHCWRCKNPIIFRATPQWFCSVDAFKDEAIKACADVDWLPAWGGERITQMIRDRADWCISRQRHWGLPIPVFYCSDCGKPICNEETIGKLSDLFAEQGSNVWFEKNPEELLPDGYVCPFCGGKTFTKDTNTLDGWFDSGSSHFAVLEDKPGHKWPADLYLEGADQYRGWFQSSLLCAVGAKGQGAPYKQVLTHGWTVDGKGEAMHKSKGNTILPDDMVKKYGGDIVRLWVASADYRMDVRCSDVIFKQLSESYRKFRNTARILLANLGDKGSDFNPNTDRVPLSELDELDKWILSRLNGFVKSAREAYDRYEFHLICQALGNFCTNDLSKLYIDISKDRTYVEGKNSPARRSAQTAMYLVLSAMTRLVAPILAYTADEIWQVMPHLDSDETENVLLNLMPEYDEALNFADIEAKYEGIFTLRDDVMKALELARNEKKIGKSLDADVTVYARGENLTLLKSFADQLASLFIVSKAEISEETAPADAFTETDSGIAVLVRTAEGTRCDRCWMYTDDAVSDGEGFVCKRCARILGL